MRQSKHPKWFKLASILIVVYVVSQVFFMGLTTWAIVRSRQQIAESQEWVFTSANAIADLQKRILDLELNLNKPLPPIRIDAAPKI